MKLLQRVARWYLARAVRDLAAGDVCSIKSEDQIKVAKVLAVSHDVVHVRLYKEKFLDRPRSVDLETLSLGRIDDPDGFGVGHLPLSPSTFGSWLPVHFQDDPVTDGEELIWVTEWERSGGGVWN